MKQYELCIQNDNNNNNNIIIIIIIIKWKKKIKRGKGRREERALERENLFYFFSFFSFLSQIYENRTAGFRRD